MAEKILVDASLKKNMLPLLKRCMELSCLTDKYSFNIYSDEFLKLFTEIVSLEEASLNSYKKQNCDNVPEPITRCFASLLAVANSLYDYIDGEKELNNKKLQVFCVFLSNYFASTYQAFKKGVYDSIYYFSTNGKIGVYKFNPVKHNYTNFIINELLSEED